MNKYGELTFLRKSDIGQVYQGIVKSTRRRVIVSVFTDAGICEGVKEFDILSRLSQSEFFVNLVERIDAKEQKRTVYRSPEAPTLIIVSEALDTELATFRMQFPNNILPLGLVRSLAFQVLTGLSEAHQAGIFVRDLRTVKIRVAGRELNNFRVKLSDFAAAKIVHNMSRNDSATPPKDLKIDDLRYQAPELLVGSRLYTSAVDLWSVGCILVEMTSGVVMFGDNSSSEPIAQLLSIFRLMGTPPTNPWPREVFSGTWGTFPRYEGMWNDIADIIGPRLGVSGVQLIKELLCYDPSETITARAALDHPFFNRQ